ncbi:hemin ABC transporter substrate-binding protein [Sphingobacterium gobiense]|uniref:Hemin ABC transporter substrate-binding protein n=2 Tax=Sphingobacterium gobiense TaxID=1382456 RepID=A0A2S9JVQ5_9SPHI|nr:hemin ABC transporter substrate-binding protein [Sphingobacterium gobiense]
MLLIGLLGGQRGFASELRIITLSSAITETVFALGLGSHIVATDVTSISPKAAAALPRVSQNRAVSAEGIMAFQPDIVLAPEKDVPPAVVQHLRQSGIKFIPLRQTFSEKGAYRFMQEIADGLDAPEKGREAVHRTKIAMERINMLVKEKTTGKTKTNVLFIYARGAGAMSVSGKGSSLDGIIELAGGKNAVQEFADFKPYTTEALVKANPDVILMFDFGVSSLGGKKAILKMPGMRLTEAGKHERIVVMNPSLLVNFSTRLPEAVALLHRELMHIMGN